ncbi:site-specific integrase [Lutibacter sp. A64]|uniref:tyrosine-type recombinase/integrase n=1 Tax=Lutibacter sp. A64 TaxID=2918526 RepID=UPI001F06FA19|nr:site-specific integrase [Lutibacter sp. A64]UMB52966.1 site-specific integrase [Lutibacter sp. A64]
MFVNLRIRKQSKGSKKFFLDIKEDGKKRYYEFLDIKIYKSDSKEVVKDKKNLAELIRSNREIEILTETTNYVPKHLKDVSFFDFADDFIANYKKKDVRMVDASLKHFKDYLDNNDLKVTHITPTIMYGFKDYLIDDCNLSGETPHNYFTRFKKILKSAELKGLLINNPTKNIKFRKVIGDSVLKKQILTTDELGVLVKTKCGNEETKKAFLFACYTGLGLAEIKILTWKNVANGKLTTKREKTKQKVEIKLKDGLLKLIGEKQSKSTPIFNLKNEKGISLSTNAINKCIKNWVERAKIDKHITFYCARHTFACQLLQYGANLKTVADAMGHTSTKSTIKYLNYIENLKDEAIDNLPDINF